MESISLLLEEALSPYQVTLTTAGVQDECLVTVKNPAGAIVVEREVDRAQLTDKRVLVDVVDCLLRDLKIAGRVLHGHQAFVLHTSGGQCHLIRAQCFFEQ